MSIATTAVMLSAVHVEETVWKPAPVVVEAGIRDEAREVALPASEAADALPARAVVSSAEQLNELLPGALQAFLLGRVVDILSARVDRKLDVTAVNKHVLATFGRPGAPLVKASIVRAGGWRTMVAQRPALLDWVGSPPAVAIRPGLNPDDVRAKLDDPAYVDTSIVVEKASPVRPARNSERSGAVRPVEAPDKAPTSTTSSPSSSPVEQPQQRKKLLSPQSSIDKTPSHAARRKSVAKSESADANGSASEKTEKTVEVLGPDPNPHYRRKVIVSPIALCRQPRGPDGQKGFSAEYQSMRLASVQARREIMV